MRRLLSEPDQIAVVSLFFMHRKGDNAQTWQEMLGRHYRIPTVSFRDAWFPEIAAGRVSWESMYSDSVHPSDTGHILASELITALFEEVRRRPENAAIGRALPEPMISDLFVDCELARYRDLSPAENNGWLRSADGKYWESSTPGNAIDFAFRGKALFLGFDLGPGATATYSID